jgi:hypothetical protein
MQGYSESLNRQTGTARPSLDHSTADAQPDEKPKLRRSVVGATRTWSARFHRRRHAAHLRPAEIDAAEAARAAGPKARGKSPAQASAERAAPFGLNLAAAAVFVSHGITRISRARTHLPPTTGFSPAAKRTQSSNRAARKTRPDTSAKHVIDVRTWSMPIAFRNLLEGESAHHPVPAVKQKGRPESRPSIFSHEPAPESPSGQARTVSA